MEEFTRPALRRKVVMYGEPTVIGKEKLSKVLGRTNRPKKLAATILNQSIKGVTIKDILVGSSDIRRILFSKKK